MPYYSKDYKDEVPRHILLEYAKLYCLGCVGAKIWYERNTSYDMRTESEERQQVMFESSGIDDPIILNRRANANEWMTKSRRGWAQRIEDMVLETLNNNYSFF